MPYLQHILLAEDDVQYAFVIQLALKQAGIDNPVQLLTSRDHVIDYMRGVAPYADRAVHPLPAAILLALRLPILEDFKALRWLRRRREFDHIRIAILSGVDYDHERHLAVDLGADAYHVKPSDFDDLVRLAGILRLRWFRPLERHAAA